MKPAVNNLSLTLESGSLTALLGPSGCGKSTILKMIAGLLPPSSGDILFDGTSILRKRPEQRGAAMVFQDHLLFPYMNIADNIGFGLKMQRLPKSEIQSRVGKMMELVQLGGFNARKPSALSGGQQQRAALARALVTRPKILLLDEPFSNLDANLRIEMRELLRTLQQEMAITTLFVTHDQEEAAVLSDRIALLLGGELRQYDTASALYAQPNDEEIARFFGGRNFISGTSREGRFECSIGTFTLGGNYRGRDGKLTFRPENVRIGDDSQAENSFDALVLSKIFLGTQTRIRLAAGGEEFDATINPEDALNLEENMTVRVRLPKQSLWVLP